MLSHRLTRVHLQTHEQTPFLTKQIRNNYELFQSAITQCHSATFGDHKYQPWRSKHTRSLPRYSAYYQRLLGQTKSFINRLPVTNLICLAIKPNNVENMW